MRKTSKNWMLFLAGIAMMVNTTSCLDHVGDDNHHPYYGYYTVTGSMDTEYVLYGDEGDLLHLDPVSVYKLCGKEGLKDAKRVYIEFTVNQSDIRESANGQTECFGVQITEYGKLRCYNPISLTTADSLKVTSKDSIQDFTLGTPWLANGYINTPWSGFYSKDKFGETIFPTISMVYDESKLSNDTIAFTLYYNRHDSTPTINSYYTDYALYCYDIAELMATIPGEDSLYLSIQTPKGKPITGRFARKSLKHPQE